MARLRYNGLRAVLGATLAGADTEITFTAPLNHSGGDPLPSISGGTDIIPMSLLTSDGQLAEIVHITDYVEGATTATILRGREGTTAYTHLADVLVIHAPTVTDFSAGGGAGGGGGALYYKGAWSSSTDYVANDLVTRSGGSYVAIGDSTNVDPADPPTGGNMGGTGGVGGNQINAQACTPFTTDEDILLTGVEVYVGATGNLAGSVGIAEPFTGISASAIVWLAEVAVPTGLPIGWYLAEFAAPITLPAGNYSIATDTFDKASWEVLATPTGVVTSVGPNAYYGSSYSTVIDEKPMKFHLIGSTLGDAFPWEVLP